jgi:hypothetical protein
VEDTLVSEKALWMHLPRRVPAPPLAARYPHGSLAPWLALANVRSLDSESMGSERNGATTTRGFSARSAGTAGTTVSARLIVSKDVHVAVIGIDFEPPLHWREPAIDHSVHGEPALPEPECERLLVALIASVALDADRHLVTILLYPGDAWVFL